MLDVPDGDGEREMRVNLDSIIAEGTTQMRGYDEKLVAQYAEAMKDGAVFPPVVVFADGEKYYLADGFHRVGAARAIKAKTIEADVHELLHGESPQRSAILYACGANDTHGRNRSAEDKRRAVETLLKDPEWSKWTDREIARQCRVHHTFVGRQRTRLINGGVLKREDKRKRKDKHGNVSEIDTSKIGKAKADGKSKSAPITQEQRKVAEHVRESTKRQQKAESIPTAELHDLIRGIGLIGSSTLDMAKVAASGKVTLEKVKRAADKLWELMEAM